MGEVVKIGEVEISNAMLNHPGEAIGYRVSYRGHAAAYISDTEHFPGRLDDNVLRLAKDADVMIYDCTYTDDEYYDIKASKIGWGHSTWQEAVKLAKVANVKQLVIFHHDPNHTDTFMDEIVRQTSAALPNSVVAKEGMVLNLMSTNKTTETVAEKAVSEDATAIAAI